MVLAKSLSTLKRGHRAAEFGVTEASLIRRAIDQFDPSSIRVPFDHAAWEEELAFIRERAKIPALGKPRIWRRPARCQ